MNDTFLCQYNVKDEQEKILDKDSFPILEDKTEK